MAEEALVMLVVRETQIGNIGNIRNIRRMREILREAEAEGDEEWVPEAGEVTLDWLLEESGVEVVVAVLAEAATDQIKMAKAA